MQTEALDNFAINFTIQFFVERKNLLIRSFRPEFSKTNKL